MAYLGCCRYCNVQVTDGTRCKDCTDVLADAQERGEQLSNEEVAKRAIARRTASIQACVNATPATIKLPAALSSAATSLTARSHRQSAVKYAAHA